MSPCEIPSRSLLWRLASREFKDNSSAHLLNNRSYLASQSSPIESKPSSLVDDLKDAHIPSIAPPESHDRLFNEFESDDGVSEIPSPVPLPVFDHSLQQAIASGRLRERCMRSR